MKDRKGGEHLLNPRNETFTELLFAKYLGSIIYNPGYRGRIQLERT